MNTIIIKTITLRPFSDYCDINLYLRMKGIKKEEIIVFKHVDQNLYVFKHGQKICDQMGYATAHLDAQAQAIFDQTFNVVS